LWLLSVTREKLESIVRHPVAVAALILFGLVLAGIAYGTRAPGDELRFLRKYADLVFVPIFITLFQAQRDRLIACYAFGAAMALTLVLSYLRWAGFIPHHGLADTNLNVPAVFKWYLTQNVLMAFAAFLFVGLGVSAPTLTWRRLWFALAFLAAANVLFVVSGRTGQLILAAFFIYLAFSFWRWKGALAVVLVVIVTMLGVGAHSRLGQTIDEVRLWQAGQPTATGTGKRLDFYRNGYQIALQHPLVGHGTGSFPKVYADHTAGSTVTPTDNPHNEYLHIAIQTGVVGLFAMLYLFYCEMRFAARLARFEQHMARALVIMMMIGCLFNSLLLDHTEGLFFAWMSGVLFGALPVPSKEIAA
jgi:O-antigen ligase